MADQTSKKLVRDLFRLSELPRLPFIPWVSTFAARLEQISVKEMLSDPTTLSNSLENAQELFGYDAIISVFDPSLEAEACGCRIAWGAEGELPTVVGHPLMEGATIEDLAFSEIEKRGRLPIILESARRLSITKGKEVALIGVITGPLTLAAHLRGGIHEADASEGSGEVGALIGLAGKIAVRLCRVYCEMGMDIVAIVDENLGQSPPDLHREVASVMRTIRNIAGFYNAYSLVITRGCRQDNIGPILRLEADGMALAGDTGYKQIESSAPGHDRCLSISIPSSALLGTLAELRAALLDRIAMLGKRRLFLSTEWDVPYQTDPSNMHELVRAIRE